MILGVACENTLAAFELVLKILFHEIVRADRRVLLVMILDECLVCSLLYQELCSMLFETYVWQSILLFLNIESMHVGLYFHYFCGSSSDNGAYAVFLSPVLQTFVKFIHFCMLCARNYGYR